MIRLISTHTLGIIWRFSLSRLWRCFLDLSLFGKAAWLRLGQSYPERSFFWIGIFSNREETPIQSLAEKECELLNSDLRHLSVRLKKVVSVYSARVGLHYRALAQEHPEGLVWIGHHATSDQLLNS